MQENYELVQRGFRILLASLSGYIGQTLNRAYKNKWWDEVLLSLYDQRDLPQYGSYDELISSIDIANCIRLIDRKWNDVYRDLLPQNCRTWAKELMGVRNITAHLGNSDLEQPMAERALDTMALLCKEIDPEGEPEIRKVYREARTRAADFKKVAFGYKGLEQPITPSRRGALKEGSLLGLVGTKLVQKTKLTRKVTYENNTVVYPVYKVRLDLLYYNDQNDRIATWISGYEAENGKEALSGLHRDIYNRIIENFIIESNPESIRKTQNNIALIGQREPGVTLADGRVVDGNRRLTCLRRLSRESIEPLYFETVIMDMDIREDKKQIKLLELAVQHGEEKKVDYDLIDFCIGTYRDVVQTKLLTAEEYATGTNEPVSEVKKRIEVARLISDFLAYIRIPEMYYAARQYQVYSLFLELLTLEKKLDGEEKQLLDEIVFTNVYMGTVTDQRKFIRDIKNLFKNDTYKGFFEDQQRIIAQISVPFSEADIASKADVDHFAQDHAFHGEELTLSMERALLRSRSAQLRSKPSENITKALSLLRSIDARQIGIMDPRETAELDSALDELENVIRELRRGEGQLFQ